TFGSLSDWPKVQPLIAQYGVQGVAFDDESTNDCGTLDANWQMAQSAIHAAGAQAWYEPTGANLQACVGAHPDMVSLADGIEYQTQFEMCDSNYAAEVTTFVQTLKAIKNVPIYAQLSVTPPCNDTISASAVESLINSVETGAPGDPDGIGVFDPLDGVTRQWAWQAVISHHRR